MLKRFLTFIVCLIAQPNFADDQAVYIADLEHAKWMARGNLLECHLEHAIPEYGRVEFIRKAGKHAIMRLKVQLGMSRAWSKAQINFEPTSWLAENKSIAGWSFDFNLPGKYVEFSSRQTYSILHALSVGQVPTICHNSGRYRGNQVIAKISTVNFNRAYSDYMQCLNTLVPLSFKEIIRSAVYFENASSQLTAETKQWLDYVIIYARELNVRRIEISGFTDSIGTFRANHKLSSSRVRNVKLYLIQHGISDRKILARIYGEHRPVADNRTPEGRAKNRRVNIRILP